MESYRNKDARRGGRARTAVSAAEAEARILLALEWRDAWRAEKQAAAKPAPLTAPAPAPTGPAGEKERRARFAASIARVEFGRAYWDIRKEHGGSGRKQEIPPTI